MAVKDRDKEALFSAGSEALGQLALYDTEHIDRDIAFKDTGRR